MFKQVDINMLQTSELGGTKVNTEGRKACLTQCLYTSKDKPSRVNKRTKILSKFDVKIHRVNG